MRTVSHTISFGDSIVAAFCVGPTICHAFCSSDALANHPWSHPIANDGTSNTNTKPSPLV
jgi:hypothetical protein